MGKSKKLIEEVLYILGILGVNEKRWKGSGAKGIYDWCQ